jgi:DNA-binding transcriptional ArsR family regulator
MPYDAQARLFKALMHPTRLAILDLLRGGEQCVCHLEAVLGQRQAYISQQLMTLREAGLIEDRREASRVYYRVIDPALFPVLDAARLYTGEPFGETDVSSSRCSCPKCRPAPAIAHLGAMPIADGGD